MTLLRADGITVTYGGVHANEDVTIEVSRGELVGLIGPNGAGKTTLLDALTGFTTPAAGRVHLDGVDVTDLAPSVRADRGLVRTFQSLELFEDLTVADNLRVAAERPGWRDVILDVVRPTRRTGAEERVDAALEAVGLAAVGDLLPTELSHGHRMLVAIGRALAGQPRVVLFDEPAAGLDVEESRHLGGRLRELVDGGTAALLVDHDMDLVLGVCDRVVVLDFGRVIATGTPTEVAHDARVLQAYLGATVESGLAPIEPSDAGGQTTGPDTPGDGRASGRGDDGDDGRGARGGTEGGRS